jgi:hypothetical protein
VNLDTLTVRWTLPTGKSASMEEEDYGVQRSAEANGDKEEQENEKNSVEDGCQLDAPNIAAIEEPISDMDEEEDDEFVIISAADAGSGGEWGRTRQKDR